MGDRGFLLNHKTTDFNVDAIDPFDTIDYYVDLMNKAKRSYVAHGGAYVGKLTNYILDKIIYIICSGKFYLNGINIGRKDGVKYTKGFGNKVYLNINLVNEMNCLDGFLSQI